MEETTYIMTCADITSLKRAESKSKKVLNCSTFVRGKSKGLCLSKK